MYKNRLRFVAIALLSCVATFSACEYSAIKEYYNDPQRYSEIWELSGVRDPLEEENTIFPKDLSGLGVVTLFCRYDQQYPLGEGVQILLEVKYEDGEDFQKRIDELSQQCFGVDEYFTGVEKVFAVRFWDDYSMEYAVVNEDEQSISYIYLQSLPKDEIEIDEKFIPIGYCDYGKVEKL